MFCMNCGQQLPDGAKFCMQCGTSLGAVAPAGTTQANTINLDGTHTFVPAMCPNCNAHMKVDSSSKIARCDTCGTECLVQDAIKALSVQGNVQVGNAVINVNSTNNDSLLDKIEIMISNGDFNIFKYCQTVLNTDPVNGRVFYYQLLANNSCKSMNEFAQNYRKIRTTRQYKSDYDLLMKYGNDNIKIKLQELENDYIKQCEPKKENAKVGNNVIIGEKDGKPYEWYIVDVQKNKALICANAPERVPYHQAEQDVTWKDCTSRKWLNNIFINKYFSQSEKAKILETTLDNDSLWGQYSPSEQTVDKVFILSESEAQKYHLSLEGILRQPVRKGYVSGIFDGARQMYKAPLVGLYNIFMWIKLDD